MRWWSVSGLVFVGLFLPGFALIGESGDTAADVVSFHAENETRLIVAFFLLAASALSYIVFVATVRAALAQAKREPRPLSALGFGGGLATAILLVVAVAPTAALADAADQIGSGGAGAAYALSFMAYPLLTIGIAASSLLALATGVLALRTGVLPRWLGWVSVVAAPIIFVAVLFLPIFVFLAWVALVSVVLLMRDSRVPAARVPASSVH